MRILCEILPKRLVETVKDQSFIGLHIFKLGKDQRPDCGLGPYWS